jgi:DNA-binding response OmpR family regulator
VISVAESDYEASAEVVRSEPDAVIIDMETSADPLGLCRWLSGTAENVAVVVIGEGNEKGPALAAGADVYTAGDAVASLKTRIRTLLE